MELSTPDVEHIAELAKIAMTPGEIEVMRGQLSNILQQFEALGRVDTEGVETTAHPSGVASVLRQDTVEECRTREETLANVPHRQGDFVRVKAVLN